MDWQSQAFSLRTHWPHLGEAIAQITVLLLIIATLIAICTFLA
ncbi:MAG: hypothetical protein WBR29_02465 [Gammaproteobacteria bacterium]